MPTPVKRSDHGFYLEGIEPRGDVAWALAGPRGRRAYWLEAARVGMQVKHRSIVLGIGRNGQPVANILPYTRAHRRSAMTRSGRGSPSAAPLVPGYTLSRTYQYLRAIVEANAVWFQWRHDPKTGMNWGKILSYQARRGRDHLGLSFDDWDAIAARMDAWWRANRARWALLGAAPQPIARGGLQTPGFGTPPKIAPPRKIAPLRGQTLAAQDAALVRSSAQAGTFSGFRRTKPGMNPVLEALLASESARSRRRPRR